MTKRLSLMVVGLGLFVGGCKDPYADLAKQDAAIRAEHAPKMAELKEKLEKARAEASKIPPLTPPGRIPGPPVVPDNGSDSKAANTAILVQDAGFCEANLAATEPFRFAGANAFCSKSSFDRPIALDPKTTPKDRLPSILENIRKRTAQAVALRYAIFVTTKTFQAPKLYLDTFRGAVYEAEARLFDLESGAYLGGFPVAAQSDSSVGVGRHESAHSQLERDFRENVEQAFTKAVSGLGSKDAKVTVGYVFNQDKKK